MIAEAAIVGLPVRRVMNATDPDEVALLNAARAEGFELLKELNTDLAQKIVKEYAEARERGKNK